MTLFNIDDVVACRRVKAQLYASLGPPSGQAGSAATGGRDNNKVLNFGNIQIPAGHGLSDKVDLPVAVGVISHMLKGAAAAEAKMWAGRLNPVRSWVQDLVKTRNQHAITPEDDRRLHTISSRSMGDINYSATRIGNAIAAGADGLNVED